jgi:hypothetical protein
VRDKRSDEARRRAAAQPGGDFELIAGNVVRRRTGADVTLQDDGRANSLPDLLIDYPDGRRAFGEVTTTSDPTYTRTFAELTINGSYPRRVERPDLARVWTVIIAGEADVRPLLADAPRLLQLLGDSEGLLEDLRQFPALVRSSNAGAVQLSGLGVLEAYSRELEEEEAGALVVMLEGISASRGPHWDALLQFVEAKLISSGWRDNREKLASSELPERHLFVEISFSPPGEPWFALARDRRDLPPRAPALPPEITHLWLLTNSGRCLAWWPDTGWQDVEWHWVSD